MKYFETIATVVFPFKYKIRIVCFPEFKVYLEYDKNEVNDKDLVKLLIS